MLREPVYPPEAGGEVCRVAGAVSIFEYEEGSPHEDGSDTWSEARWALRASIDLSGHRTDDDRISVHGSLVLRGDRLAIPIAGRQEESVVIYELTESGWLHRATRTSDLDEIPGQEVGCVHTRGALFGDAIALTNERIYIGSPRALGRQGERDAGAIEVWERTESGAWIPAGPPLRAPVEHEGASFGASLAADGAHLAVGAPGSHASARGPRELFANVEFFPSLGSAQDDPLARGEPLPIAAPLDRAKFYARSAPRVDRSSEERSGASPVDGLVFIYATRDATPPSRPTGVLSRPGREERVDKWVDVFGESIALRGSTLAVTHSRVDGESLAPGCTPDDAVFVYALGERGVADVEARIGLSCDHAHEQRRLRSVALSPTGARLAIDRVGSETGIESDGGRTFANIVVYDRARLTTGHSVWAARAPDHGEPRRDAEAASCDRFARGFGTETSAFSGDDRLVFSVSRFLSPRLFEHSGERLLFDEALACERGAALYTKFF